MCIFKDIVNLLIFALPINMVYVLRVHVYINVWTK